MAKESKDLNGKFIAGAILGVLAGAVAGVLFAPRGGKETRKLVSDKAKEYGEKGKKIVEKEAVLVKEAVGDTVQAIAEKIPSKQIQK